MTIIKSQQHAVLTLTLARPDKKNALSTAMYLALTEALLQADMDPSVHVVVLRGQEN